MELLLQKLTAVRYGFDPIILVPARGEQLLEKAARANIPNPFSGLPNVRSSYIRANIMDPLLAKFGIASKFSPEMKFDPLSRRLRASNRYLQIMHLRAVKFLINRDHYGYWIFCMSYMQRSKVLKLVALRKLEHNWHTQMKLGAVKHLLQRLQDKIDNLSVTLNIRRDYALKVKPDGKQTWRPIGNPVLVDRMYTYLLQSFLVVYFYSYIGDYQHGFLPKRGTLTAWKAIAKQLYSSPYIYEFDLKGAFPSVSIEYAFGKLKELGMPFEIADFFRIMSISAVEVVDRTDQRLPEPKVDAQEEILSDTFDSPSIYTLPDGRRILIQDLMMWSAYQDESLLLPPDKPELAHRSDLLTVAGEHKLAEGELIPTHLRGFPQGLGTSPIFFNFVFENVIRREWLETLSPHAKIIAYADDFLVFCKHKLANFLSESPAMADSGLHISPEKSREIKARQWQVFSFKFLGIKVIPFGNELLVQGAPKSGKVLDFDKSKEKAINKYIKRDHELQKFRKALDLSIPTQAILDGFGRGEAPFDLLPSEVVEGAKTLKASTLEAIKAVHLSRTTNEVPMRVHHLPSAPDLELQELARRTARIPHDEIINPSPSPTPPVIEDSMAKRISELDMSSIIRTLTDDSLAGYERMVKWLSRSNATRWLGSRKAGLILSRLYDGQWIRAADHSSSLDLKASVPPRTEGRSWFELLGREQLVHKGVQPNLHNSTSLAMLDLLNAQRDPAVLKLRRTRVGYKQDRIPLSRKGK